MSPVGIRIAVGLAALAVCASGCRKGATAASAGVSATSSTVTSNATLLPSATALPAATGQPAPGQAASSQPAAPASCHARGSGLYVLPDASCTPGATNPAVTQASIGRTICTSGWTATVRPPESYTEPLKYRQMAAYSDTGSAGDYEEDHLIPLELGGSPTSPQNLWPEPGASPNPKDAVESAANHAVCEGRMTLAAAQQAIAANWIAFGQQLGVVPAELPATAARPTSGAPAAAAPPATKAPSGQAATCSASASYDSKYGDWDVYVHSNQPSQTVTVTASGGEAASYHTDSSGYADVYLHAAQSAGGQRVTLTVGGASCTAAL